MMQSHSGHTFKNDGVVNIHSARWSADDQLDDNENSYFDDVDEDGGYNHFELRHYKRTYDLPDDNGGYAFRAGDKNPTMQEVENWIFEKLKR